MTCSRSSLDTLMSLDFESLRSQRIDSWKNIAASAQNEFVIFGAGELGIKVLKSLKAVGLRPIAFLDNNASMAHSTLENIPVVHPNIAMERLGQDVLVLLSVFNTSKPREQLKELGFNRIIHCAYLFAGIPDVALPYVCLDDTDVVFQSSEQVKAAFDLMEDEASRDLFLAQVRYRLFMDFDRVLSPQTAEMKQSEYFPSDLYRFFDDEVLVDCGAFSGDTVKRFLSIRNENFKKIYAFEPDVKNYAHLKEYVKGLPQAINVKIETKNQGVGNSIGLVRFHSDGTVRSLASNEGSDVVSIVRLDEAASKTTPTLIKMDIEGGEIDALQGCEEIIRSHKPVLAICVYHSSQHLWSVPLLIHKLCKDYQFFLRAHAEDCWDVTCYAIPKDRLAT